MNNFNEGLADSLLRAVEKQSEAEKRRKDSNSDKISSNENSQSEESVSTENRPVVKAPISPEDYISVEKAHSRTLEINNEIARRAEPLIKEIYAKLEAELGKKEAYSDWQKIIFETDKKTREAVEIWIRDIYEGKHGRGEVAISAKYGEIPRLVRVVPIQNPTARDITREQYAESITKLENEGVVDHTIRPPKEGSLFNVHQNHQYNTEFSINLETCAGLVFSSINNFFDKFYFAEVDFAGTTEEELDILYKKLLQKGWLLSTILETFPENYEPKVQVGEILSFGGCHHHSGDIEGLQIILPSGRLAVISQYNGEKGHLYEEYQFWGILTDPKTAPVWSARNGCWQGVPLDQPTAEEIEFLRSKKVEFHDGADVIDMKQAVEPSEELDYKNP